MLDDPCAVPEESKALAEGNPDCHRARSALRRPAVALIGLSSLSIALDLGVLAEAILNDAPKMMRDEGAERGRELIIANVVANGGLLFVHAFVLYGSLRMLRIQSYASALMAAIISLFPFFSPVVLLGIPFGIWAIALLLRRNVRWAFRVGPGSIATGLQEAEAVPT